MSYEGFEQVLCKNGHYVMMYCYSAWYSNPNWECSICKEKRAWSNFVDQTNCCVGEENCKETKEIRATCEGFGVGYVKLEVKEKAKFGKHDKHGRTALLSHETYKIPPKGIGYHYE